MKPTTQVTSFLRVKESMVFQGKGHSQGIRGRLRNNRGKEGRGKGARERKMYTHTHSIVKSLHLLATQKSNDFRNFSGGPVLRLHTPNAGVRVPSWVVESDPAYHN